MAANNFSQTWFVINDATSINQDTEFQVQQMQLFHDSWKIAFFLILLLFVLTVISLVLLAFLHELLLCCFCTKSKSLEILDNEPHAARIVMSTMKRHKIEMV
ncbi:small integral membrane protein 18 [Chiloscyllium punctatum]|uniref:small integral membrane protein 18 n=1 Tax=Chiloscyllium plagiosum TaxID=36176 RepID=UPI001CB84F66|nr:small integral membrane protein 18 [Chiloscyllium plagiosum]